MASEEVDHVELECYDLLRELGIPFESMPPIAASNEAEVIKGREPARESWVEGSNEPSTSTERPASPSARDASASSSTLPADSIGSTSIPSPSRKVVDDSSLLGRDPSSSSVNRDQAPRPSSNYHYSSSRARSRSPQAGRRSECSRSREDDATRSIVVCENIPRGINKRQLEKHFQGLRFSRIDLWQKEDRSFIAEVVLSCPSEARLAVQRLHEPKTILSPHPITVRLATPSSSRRSSPRSPSPSHRHAPPQDPSTQTRSSFDSKFDLNRLFIPSLDSLVSGAQLRELFSRFGTVRSCVAVVKYGTKNHYQAFVTYENPQDAYAALKATDGQLIGSWKTSVKFALLDKKAQPPILKPKQTKGRDAIFTLFVSGLSHLTSSEDLRETFSKHGEVSKVHIPASTNGNPSFIMGFVRFKNQWDVAHARLALNGSTLRSARIRVTTAQTELS